MTETEILFAVRSALVGSGLVRLRRNNVGFDRERRVHYGAGLGSPDLLGWLVGSGRTIGFEVKSPKGRLSKEQRLWIDDARATGPFVAVVRSADEAIAALERAIRGGVE